MSARKEPQEAFERRLLLYWEVAQPLKHIFRELPELEERIPANMVVKLPPRKWNRQTDIADVLRASVESKLSLSFQNLPEAQFERLALRFRPFFANGEQTNFLRTIAAIAAQYEEMVPWQKSFKQRWNRAVFWGAMGMPERDPPVTADGVIDAGFYSRYFHVSPEGRKKAKAYEASLGTTMFRVALVSSVWQRSALVLSVADEIEDWLLNRGLLSEAARDEAASPAAQPERLSLEVQGGEGAIQLKELGRPALHWSPQMPGASLTWTPNWAGYGVQLPRLPGIGLAGA